MTQTANPAPQASGPESTLRLSLTDVGSSTIYVSVTPPKEPGSDGTPETRAPIDLCCVVDVSGSMDDDAAVPSEADKPLEVTGLSILDVTKHALRTVIASLGDEDRLALVSFSSTAKVVAHLTKTTERGKKSLLVAVEALRPDAATNLWDGLKVGMNLLNNETSEGTSASLADSAPSNRLQSLFLLTDGVSNIIPPRGNLPMLKQYLEAHPQSQFTVSTFGFGYNLDSKLLSELAGAGGGGYGFIPDAGMVGTVFVHALGNLMATYSTRAALNVEIPEGVTLKSLKGSFPTTSASWGSKIEIGDIQYGQTREFILEFQGTSNSSEITVFLSARPWYSTSPETLTQSLSPSPLSIEPEDAFLTTKYRLDLVSYIYHLCSQAAHSLSLSDAGKYFPTTAGEIKQTLPTHEDALALAKDMEGELTLAVQTVANWRKWGIHYFPSLARSHQRQQCGNFKDASLQVYGKESPLFIQSRDMVDAKFDDLPPPKPTKKVVEKKAAPGQRAVQYQALHSMRQYNQSIGPCFSGNSLVQLSDGQVARVDEVKRGMKVKTLEGEREVAVVIKTVVPGGKLEMCKIGELKITPWHPMQYEGKWVFPVEISLPSVSEEENIYSFLLQPSKNVDAHSMFIGGIPCVTMGHGLVQKNGNDVRAHGFFGSYENVLKELALMPGFADEEGVVRCMGVKRSADRLICGFVPIEEVEEITAVHQVEIMVA